MRTTAEALQRSRATREGITIMQWLKKLFGGDPDFPRPAMDPGEDTILEGRAAFVRGLIGSRNGPLILTNRRILWYEDTWPGVWPLKRISGEARLSDIAAVDKGAPLDFIFGGRGLRLRLKPGRFWGKHKRFWVDDISQWVDSVRAAVAAVR